MAIGERLLESLESIHKDTSAILQRLDKTFAPGGGPDEAEGDEEQDPGRRLEEITKALAKFSKAIPDETQLQNLARLTASLQGLSGQTGIEGATANRLETLEAVGQGPDWTDSPQGIEGVLKGMGVEVPEGTPWWLSDLERPAVSPEEPELGHPTRDREVSGANLPELVDYGLGDFLAPEAQGMSLEGGIDLPPDFAAPPDRPEMLALPDVLPLTEAEHKRWDPLFEGGMEGFHQPTGQGGVSLEGPAREASLSPLPLANLDQPERLDFGELQGAIDRLGQQLDSERKPGAGLETIPLFGENKPRIPTESLPELAPTGSPLAPPLPIEAPAELATPPTLEQPSLVQRADTDEGKSRPEKEETTKLTDAINNLIGAVGDLKNTLDSLRGGPTAGQRVAEGGGNLPTVLPVVNAGGAGSTPVRQRRRAGQQNIG